jgi:hypothetical protein
MEKDAVDDWWTHTESSSPSSNVMPLTTPPDTPCGGLILWGVTNCDWCVYGGVVMGSWK